MPTIISRKEAKDRGLNKYFTGKPCKNGHLSERYTKSKHCITCSSISSKNWNLRNPEAARAKARNWARANRSSRKHKSLDYYYAHRGARLEYRRNYYKNNKKKANDATMRWRRLNPRAYGAYRFWYIQNNKHLFAKYAADRRARKFKATPGWADSELIALIYEECLPGHHVDHIVPLVSDVVCGLHTQENLQYLPAKVNAAKGNSLSATPIRRHRI